MSALAPFPAPPAVGDEVTFLPGGADPAADPPGVALLRVLGFYNVFTEDLPSVTVTGAPDGVTVESDNGAGWFPDGVVLTFRGDRANWRRGAGF